MKPYQSNENDYIHEEKHPGAGIKSSSLCGELRHGKYLGVQENISRQVPWIDTVAMSKDKCKCLARLKRMKI